MKKKIFIFISVIMFFIGISLYFNNLKKLLGKSSSLQLNLHSIRVDLEKINQKDFAYSECIVDQPFLKMWTPWTFNKIVRNLEDKMDYCEEKLEERKFQLLGKWSLYLDCPNTTYTFNLDNTVDINSCNGSYRNTENIKVIYSYDSSSGRAIIELPEGQEVLNVVENDHSDDVYSNGYWLLEESDGVRFWRVEDY